jgi:hypothetical protein
VRTTSRSSNSQQREIHPDFKQAYKAARGTAPAVAADCSRFALSRWFNKPVAPTPFVLTKLAQLAALLDYSGPIWREDR